MNYEFYQDERGQSVFELPRQQKFVIKAGSNFISPSAMLIEEAIDWGKMEECIQHTFDAYDTLRYIAVDKDGDTYYKIVKDYKYKLNVYVATGDDHDQRYKDALAHVSSLCSEPMDVFNELSVRIGIVKVEDDQYIFYLIGHPWIVDGTSCAIITDRLMKEYRGVKEEYPHALQNHEFMEWYLDFERSDKGKKEFEFWQKYMDGYEKFDVSPMYVGEKASPKDYYQNIPSDDFNQAAKAYKTSLFNVFIMAYHVSLYHILGVKDTLIPLSDSCRVKKEHFGVVGNLVRQTGHRMVVDESDKLADVMKRSIEIMSTATKYHHVAVADPRTQFGVSYNNFRKSEEFHMKNISSQITNSNVGMRNHFLFVLLELPTGLNFCYMCNDKVSKDTLVAFGKSIPLIVNLLVNEPEITIAETKKRFEENV